MTTINLTIAADIFNYDIYVQAGSPAGVVDVTVTVNAGVVVGSHSSTPAMYQSGSFAVGSTVTITNNGTIKGRGGDGGQGGVGAGGGFNGKIGRTALRLGQNTTLVNNGTILGGGGGGGGGAGASGPGGGGGGGAGVDSGDGGAKGGAGSNAGSAGSALNGGAGGTAVHGGTGGDGGDLSHTGSPGADTSYNTGGDRGAAGTDIDLNGFTLVSNNVVTLPLASMTLTGLTPTFNVGGGMTLPLAIMTLTGLVPAAMGAVARWVGGGGGWGTLSKPPFNEGIPDTIWNWLLKVWRWASGETTPAASQTANFSATSAYFYPVDATAGSITVTLPKCTLALGKKYVIKKTDVSANTVTIVADTTVPDLIDGAATKVLTKQYDTIFIESDGISNWWRLASTAKASTSPLTAKGDIWGYDTTDNRIPIGTDTYVLTADSAQTLGLKWAPAAASGPAMTVSTSAPVSANSGDFWWKSDEGQLKIYFTDADSSQWVDAMNVNTGGTGVTGSGMTKIAQVVCASSQATIVFSNIPGTYTSLSLILSGRDTGAVSTSFISMFFNSDTTASNYSITQQSGAFGSTGSVVQTSPSTAGGQIGYITGSTVATAVGMCTITIPNYAQTVFMKPVFGYSAEHRGLTTNQGVWMREFTWLSTAAITDITLTAGTTAFVDGTTATLYGLA